jgi:hypothetical protein
MTQLTQILEHMSDGTLTFGVLDGVNRGYLRLGHVCRSVHIVHCLSFRGFRGSGLRLVQSVAKHVQDLLLLSGIELHQLIEHGFGRCGLLHDRTAVCPSSIGLRRLIAVCLTDNPTGCRMHGDRLWGTLAGLLTLASELTG